MKRLIYLLPFAVAMFAPFLMGGCSGGGNNFADQPKPDLNKNTQPGVTRGTLNDSKKGGG